MKNFMRLLICLALTTSSLAVHAQSNNKGATPVEVENGPNNPVPVSIQQDQTREPELIEVTASRGNSTESNSLFVQDRFKACVGAEPVCETGTGKYKVPDGKQLVIRHISFGSRSYFIEPPPGPVGATLELSNSDVNQGFVFATEFEFGQLEPLNPQLQISGKGFQTQITVPPRTGLLGRLVWADIFVGQRDGQFTIAGEYVDIP